MEQTIIATVTLVWALGAAVAVVAWFVGGLMGDTVMDAVRGAWAREAIKARKAGEVPSSAPRIIARTPAEFNAWRAEQLASAPTLPGSIVTVSPRQALEAWAANRGLRMASDGVATVVDARPLPPEAAPSVFYVSESGATESFVREPLPMGALGGLTADLVLPPVKVRVPSVYVANEVHAAFTGTYGYRYISA